MLKARVLGWIVGQQCCDVDQHRLGKVVGGKRWSTVKGSYTILHLTQRPANLRAGARTRLTCMYDASSGISDLSVGEISFDRSSCKQADAHGCQFTPRHSIDTVDEAARPW